MALTPNSIEYGQARLEMTLLLNERDLNASLASTTFPNAHISATTVSVTITNVAGASNTGTWALALVEDNTDVGGNFTNAAGTALSSGVLCYRQISNGTDPVGTYVLGDGSGPDAGLNAALSSAGTMRLVLIRGSAPLEAKRLSEVDVGPASNEYHADSDGSLATGGAAAVSIQVKRAGWIGRRAKLPASGLTVSPSDNQRYRDQPTITLNMAPATSGTAFINPKQVRLAVSTDAAGSTLKKTADVTPDTSGDTTTTYKVDTDFALTASDHYLQLGVNDTLGNANTPAGQKPGLASVATVNGLTASQQAWVLFDNSHDAAYTQVSASQVRDAGGITIASGLQLFKNIGLTTAGVGSFSASDYATTQDIFKRTGAVNTLNAVPFLETYIADAYGAKFASVSSGFSAAVQRQSDSTAEDTQTLSTNADGRVRWNYTISATAPAFSRYVKTAAARQTGSHVATGPDDSGSPPATFSAGNGAYTGPFPAYARKVVMSGTGFSAGKEPSVTQTLVFGINSELVFEALWVGPLTAASLNANGVPTGAGATQQTLGSGSLRIKLTTGLDSSNIVVNVSEFNPKDVAGRNISLAGAESLTLRRTLWDDTNDTVSDAGTNLTDANTSLDDDSTLGYHTGNASLDTVAAPADPTTYIYGQGAADTSAQRATFALTASGASPVIGFTGDSGNFGYLTRTISFASADLSIGIALSPQTVQASPGAVVRFGAHVFRLTPDNTFVDAPPDSAPVYVAYGLNDDGSQIKVVEGATTLVSGADFYMDLTIPSSYAAIKIHIYARVSGAITAGGGEAHVEIFERFLSVGKSG